MCVYIYANMISRSNKQAPSYVTCMCVFVYVYVWRGHGGGSPAFCHGTLDKTKTTHFSGPLPRSIFSNKSGLWLQGPDNTSSLHLSPGCCGGGDEVLGVGAGGMSLHSRQTMLFECKASSASNPSPTLSITTATLLLFRWISQLFLDGLSHRRSSTGDMSSKPGHHPMWPLT